MFYKLRHEYENVEWVSRNAARAKINPEGSDEHGYDISYIDNDDHLHFVEVKGNSAYQKHFFVSKFEVSVAMLKKEYYHVYYVPYALDTSRSEIKNLGNIFLFNDGQDVFNNERFTATYETLEIFFA